MQKILSDLSKISQLQDRSNCALASPSRIKNNQQQSNDVGSMQINDLPLPSPQPSRPSCSSPAPSMNGDSVTGWVNSSAIDFDQIINPLNINV